MKLRRHWVLWPLAVAGGLCVVLAAAYLLNARRPSPGIANICADPKVFQIELMRPFFHARIWMYVAAVGNDTWNTPRFLKHPLLGNMRLGPANTEQAPRRSTVILCEDELQLGPPHARQSQIVWNGNGHYAHYQGSGHLYQHFGILFSASDNTDPNVNGRRYRAIEP